MPRSTSASSLAPPPFTASAPTTFADSGGGGLGVGAGTAAAAPAAAAAPPPPRPPHHRSRSSPSPRAPTPVPTTPTMLQPSPSLFAPLPPFYNRPPTPLPPSPSLTSLLRPPFTPSRPTTPDSSDSEGIITHSSQLSARTPRYAPKVPTYEYYGFMLYVISLAAFLLYILWSFAPARVLEAVGLSYYPSRWWSLALPSYLVVVVCYIFVALAGYNTSVLTFPLGALETVVDIGGNIAAVAPAVNTAAAAAAAATAAAAAAAAGEGSSGGDGGGGGGMPPIAPLASEQSVDSAADTGRSEKWGDMLRQRDRSGSGSGSGNGLSNSQHDDWKGLWSRGTDAVMDVPIGGVCEVLYGAGREREVWELEEGFSGV